MGIFDKLFKKKQVKIPNELESKQQDEVIEKKSVHNEAIDEYNKKLSTNKVVKKGLTITNGMGVEVRKEGHLYRAYDDSGRNYSSVISNTRRKKAWEQNNNLKAKISIVHYPEWYDDNRVTWSLDDSSNYREKLIEKYGEKDGMLIFNKKISEKNYLKKNKLIEKYGEKYGMAVFNRKVLKGMNLSMVEGVIGKYKYNAGDDYYFGKPFKKKIVFSNDKMIENKPIKDKIWIDMPKDMLIASWGRPGDKKETVTKSSVKQRLFFNSRENRQGGKSYEYQVDIENDLVIGWKELE
jgi:hypothetical protein